MLRSDLPSDGLKSVFDGGSAQASVPCWQSLQVEASHEQGLSHGGNESTMGGAESTIGEEGQSPHVALLFVQVPEGWHCACHPGESDAVRCPGMSKARASARRQGER